MIEQYIKRLEQAGHLAEQSKWQRLRYAPFRLAFSFLHRKYIYPSSKKGMLKQANTFFDVPMTVNLPAGTDIYLLGVCLLYTSPSPRDLSTSRMPSSA